MFAVSLVPEETAQKENKNLAKGAGFDSQVSFMTNTADLQTSLQPVKVSGDHISLQIVFHNSCPARRGKVFISAF